jgi:hypothetical protein
MTLDGKGNMEKGCEDASVCDLTWRAESMGTTKLWKLEKE